MSSKTFYITTPIYYSSGDPHIGHCYTTVACDAIARYKRWQGYRVMFSTGQDEHGEKVAKEAEKAGLTPQQYVDGVAVKFKKLWEYMNVSYDRFIRTTDAYHEEGVQRIFQKLYDAGYIYKGDYVGKYCVPDESFWTASQLVDGKCPDCGREVVEMKEEAYFFKLSAFSERLEELLTKTEFLRPENRVTEMVNNFIKPGLEDLCISRTSLKWGIKVPVDEKHVIYVWLDALTNYITLLGYENEEFDDMDFWACDVHMTANEIVRFHSIIWPAFLMALELPLPKRLYSHGWINFSGKKMSKSLGNVVNPFILGERYGVDAVRYQILRDMPYGSDMSYSNESMITRINADLANDLGNLVSRTVAMVEKYFNSELPAEKEFDDSQDGAFTAAMKGLRAKTDAFIDEQKHALCLEEIFKVVSQANKYIDETMPWILAKDEARKPRLAAVLYNLLEGVRITSSLLASFMPETMPKIWEQIGASPEHVTYENAAKYGVLPANAVVKRGAIIFPRFDAEKEIEALNALIGK